MACGLKENAQAKSDLQPWIVRGTGTTKASWQCIRAKGRVKTNESISPTKRVCPKCVAYLWRVRHSLRANAPSEHRHDAFCVGRQKHRSRIVYNRFCFV